MAERDTGVILAIVLGSIFLFVIAAVITYYIFRSKARPNQKDLAFTIRTESSMPSSSKPRKEQ